MKRRGFTLVELLVVIVIIAVLAALLVVLVKGMIARARNNSTKALIEVLSHGCDVYRTDTGAWPPAAPFVGSQNLHYHLGSPRQVEMQAGIAVARPPIIEFKREWLDPAAASTLPSPPAFIIDRFGNPIQYACPGINNLKGVDIWSNGSDPADAADDLANWLRD